MLVTKKMYIGKPYKKLPLWEKWFHEREQPTQGSWETVTQMLQLPPWWNWTDWFNNFLHVDSDWIIFGLVGSLLCIFDI